MPIKRTRQNWSPGNTVKIGFLELEVISFHPTPKDYKPDEYRLKDKAGRIYSFVPHYGLKRITD